MTIYKSHQVNLDPEPWACHSIVTRDGGKSFERAEVRRHAEEHEGDVHWEPRPEFELTRDPEPHLFQGHRYRADQVEGIRRNNSQRDVPAKITWSPRRERFDTPVNRVLVDFREHWALLAPAPGSRAAQIYLEVTDLDGGKKPPLNWSGDEIDHARRVLTRLAGWSA